MIDTFLIRKKSDDEFSCDGHAHPTYVSQSPSVLNTLTLTIKKLIPHKNVVTHCEK